MCIREDPLCIGNIRDKERQKEETVSCLATKMLI